MQDPLDWKIGIHGAARLSPCQTCSISHNNSNVEHGCESLVPQAKMDEFMGILVCRIEFVTRVHNFQDMLLSTAFWGRMSRKD